MYRNFDEILSRAKQLGPSRAAVLFPQDTEVMISVLHGIEAGLIAPVLVGHKARILSVAKEINLPLDHIELRDEPDPQKASELCLDLATRKEVRFIVKGKILSSYPYRALIAKSKILSPEETSSTICFHQAPGLDKIFIATDPGTHILPDLETKKKILLNAIRVSRQLGCPVPHVMVLAADHVDGTVSAFAEEADELLRFAEGGGLGPCHIYPATNLFRLFSDTKTESATFPDIFLFPNIETGNIVCKSIDHLLMGVRQCVALGGGSIILAPSRSDTHEVRMINLALGPILSEPVPHTEN